MKKIPLSKNQEQFWILYKLYKDNPAYNLPSVFRIKGALNIEALRWSISELIKQHEILRTCFIEEDDQPWQVIKSYDDKMVEIPIIVINGQPDECGIPEVIIKEIHRPFELGTGSLLRITLFSFGTDSYILTIVFHHIIVDFYSKEIFSNELSLFYNSRIRGTLPLIEKAGVYSDFCKWQQEWLGKDEAKKMVAEWENDIFKSEEVLKLPSDFLPVNNIRIEGKRKHFMLDIDISKKVRHFCKKHSTHPFALLLTVYSIFLNRLTGQSYISIGVPFTNRRKEEFKGTFGCFMNILPIQVSFTVNSTLSNLLEQVRKKMLNAHRRQELPFLLLNQNLGQIDRKAIFQAGFTFEAPMQLFLSELEVSPLVFERKGSQLDLFLTLWEEESCFHAFLEYSSHTFKEETISRYWKILKTIIQATLSKPDICIGDLSIIPSDDFQHLNSWNDTDIPFEDDLCIHRKFEQQVELDPDAPALLTKTSTLTYKELNEQANRIAHFLISKGVKHEDIIGICMYRSVEMMICIFGVLKAGAAYLPLNPENPKERLQVILNDAKPKLLLTDGSIILSMGNQINICEILSNPVSLNITNPDIKINSRRLAYLIYTSGSTGVPKGVLIEHRSVINRLSWMQNAFPIGNTDTLLQKTPITFDVSVWELFWWAFNGARLVILPINGEKKPETLIEYISDFKVTVVHFVPSMFITFFEFLNVRRCVDRLCGLKRIFLSGEALPVTLVNNFNQLRSAHALPELINLYGPTEATVDITSYVCPENQIEKVYIGRPIDNTKLFVITENDKIQPVGIPGELVITGVNLARGYLNNELTKEKFLNLRLQGRKTIRGYRTGDLVKLTDGGELEYLGRKDNQVKIRGFRIELGEIESKLFEHPLIENCAVVTSGEAERKTLIAYVCLKPGKKIGGDDLRTYLSGKLPDYMVPSGLVFLDNLPLTTEGKLDRRNLPLSNNDNYKKNIISPANNCEKRLLKLWKELLRIENISIYDNFFDIGGNSLLAIKMTSMIVREFEVDLETTAIIENPKIKELGVLLTPGVKKSLILNNEIDEKIRLRKNINFKTRKNL